MKKKGILGALFALFMTLALVGCGGGGGQSSSSGSGGSSAQTQAQAKPKAQKLKIHMLDVGQGDAILVESPTETILIDTSDKDETEKLRSELRRLHVTDIDKLILTHPHADHIGGAETVLRYLNVKAVYDNGQPATSKVYKRYMEIVNEKKIPYRALHDGDVLDFGGGVTFKVFSPTQKMVEEGGHDSKKNGKINLNLNSIVGRLEYGTFSMLFTGDAEEATERGIVDRHKKELPSDILKVGHHGSNTSSSVLFLKEVNPSVAVISCGIGNEYHHPHPSIRQRFQSRHLDYYRTDKNGAITIETDGKGEKNKKFKVSVAKGGKNNNEGN